MFLNLKKSRSGFTLIEVLIASTLVLAVLVCAGSGLFQGIRLYEKLISVSQDEKIAFFFERLTKDLKNSSNYTKAGFFTSGPSVSFASLRVAGEAGETYFEARPVKVTYEFDPKLGEVKRTEKDLIQSSGTKQEVLLSNLQAFNLSVLGNEKDPFPRSVQVELTVASKKYEKKISVPLNYAPAR